MFWFIFALAAGIAAAAAISPFAAAFISATGLHIPFPRIFDRTVLATLADQTGKPERTCEVQHRGRERR